jgi:hypothetical protein
LSEKIHCKYGKKTGPSSVVCEKYIFKNYLLYYFKINTLTRQNSGAFLNKNCAKTYTIKTQVTYIISLPDYHVLYISCNIFYNLVLFFSVIFEVIKKIEIVFSYYYIYIFNNLIIVYICV